MLRQARSVCGVSAGGLVSAGQFSIRKADQHAKVQLKKEVRGVRVEERTDLEAEVNHPS